MGLGSVLKRVGRKVEEGFSSLKGSPRGLWITFILQVLESYNYFSLSLCFTLYLSEQFGVDDFKAGSLYGLWGTLLVLYGFPTGGLIDFLGVRNSLVVCYLVNIVARFVVASTHSQNVLVWTLLGPVTIAGVLGSPVLTIGIKRYTTEVNRGFAFSVFYSLMNVAATACAASLDFFRVTLQRGFNMPQLPLWLHFLNDGTRLMLFSSVLTSIVALFLSLMLTEADVGVDSDDEVSPHKPSGVARKDVTRPLLDDEEGSVDSAEAGKASALAGYWQVAKDMEFWKYIAMTIFTVNLKQIFRHVDATLPKYLIREFGCDVKVGMVYGINPLMITFLVPIAGALLTRFSHFDVIHCGSYISALSPFWIVAFPDHFWAPVLFVVQLSLGEAIWSPRWYDYSMSVAPEGREGVFTALASAPLFAAKLPTGMLSGYLLSRYCPDAGSCTDPTAHPEEGVCDGRSLWGIIGLLTLSSPLLIFATQRFIRPKALPGAPPHHHHPPEPLGVEPSDLLVVPAHDMLEEQEAVDVIVESHMHPHHRHAHLHVPPQQAAPHLARSDSAGEQLPPSKGLPQ